MEDIFTKNDLAKLKKSNALPALAPIGGTKKLAPLGKNDLGGR